jgi:beta-glucosidase
MKPVKELKEFEKIYLEPEEEKIVTFELNSRAFAFYQVNLKDWYVDKGTYKIMIGSSSRDILLEETIKITPLVELPKKITGWSKVERFKETEAVKACLEEIKLSMENYVDESLTSIFQQKDFKEQLENLSIRMITLYTQTVINNDIMEEYLRKCNEEYLQVYKQKKSK